MLDTPRVYFRGEMTWDPITTNNFDQLYDMETGRPKLGEGTAAEYRERVRRTIVDGNWNPHGTHRSSFVDTIVGGVDRGNGLEDDDPLVGQPLSFDGMLVDLDTYGATSSQLFFDQLACGSGSGSRIVAPRAGPMVARRLNFARNLSYRVIAGVASVVWQTSFPKTGGLSVQPQGSPVLAALAAALDDDDVQGLTVRFNAFRTVYYGRERPTPQQARALADAIAAGGIHPNPARSTVVGVIGLWRRGEPPSVPAERVLARRAGSQVSTAFAKVGDRRLSVDLANSVPETGFDLKKLDLGPLAVVSRMPGGPDVTLATLPYRSYDAAAYRATAGIVDVALDDAQVAAAREGDLEVRAADGTPVLSEQPLTVCADPPNAYLEEGESTTVHLRAFERGGPPSSPVSVTLAEVGGPLVPPPLETDGGGEVTVPLSGGTPGSRTWVLVPWRGTPPPMPTDLEPDVSEYLALRTVPADGDMAALEPTWDNVYRQVLRHWDALAPAMDNWLRLGDEQQCRSFAPVIKALTSPERFDDYRYMPVTRDLSPGQRALLHRWCDAVASGTPPERAAALEAGPGRDPFGRGF